MTVCDRLWRHPVKVLGNGLDDLCRRLYLRHVAGIGKHAQTGGRHVGWRHDAVRRTPQNGEGNFRRERGWRCRPCGGRYGAKRFAPPFAGERRDKGIRHAPGDQNLPDHQALQQFERGGPVVKLGERFDESQVRIFTDARRRQQHQPGRIERPARGQMQRQCPAERMTNNQRARQPALGLGLYQSLIHI